MTTTTPTVAEPTEECAYCNADVPAEDTVPEVADDDAWDALAPYHHPTCEWVETRAHRCVMEPTR